MSASGKGDSFVIGYININKYTSASENVHLCFRKNRQLGHISVATGRIPSLFCDNRYLSILMIILLLDQKYGVLD